MKVQLWLAAAILSIWQVAGAQSIVRGEGSTFIIDYDPAYTEPMIAVIEGAAQFYADVLRSDVPVHVYIDAIQLNCTSGYTNHVLTSTPMAAINFPNAPQSDVYYPSALANAFAGTDLFPQEYDIRINFNRNMINRAHCIKWYLGDDMSFSFQHHSLKYETMQELAHGLGLMPLGDLMRGQQLNGKPDVYWQQLRSHQQGAWITDLTAASIEVASHRNADLAYSGAKGLAAAESLEFRLDAQTLLLFSRTYDAPTLTGMHLHESTKPLQLMTVNLRDEVPQVDLAIAMLEDLGWRTTYNKPAIINSQRAISINEDTRYVLSLNDFDISDESPESLVLTAATSAGSAYSLNGNEVIPAPNFFGTLTVPVTITDDGANQTQAEVLITVNAVNDAPVVTGQQALSVAEDNSLLLTAEHLVIEDIDSGEFTLTVNSGNLYTVIGNRITPTSNYFGQLTIPVSVNDGSANSNLFALTVDVTPVNDAPVILGQLEIVTNEETAITIGTHLLTIEDVDSSSFSLLLQGGEHYTINGNTVIPEENFNGELIVPASVSDGSSSSALFNIKVTVTPQNDPPVITAQRPLSVAEDTQLTLTEADFSIEDMDGDTTSLQILAGNHYQINGNSVTPVLNFNGNLTVAVRAYDGIAYSEIFNAQVEVTPVNDAPVLSVTGPLNMLEDGSLFLSHEDLHIIDPDNDSFTLNIAAGANYQVALNEIIPAANWYGELIVPVSVNDGELDSNRLELNIVVAPVNDLPEMVDSHLKQGQIYRDFSQQLTAVDIDGDSLSFSLANAPAWLSISNDGLLTGLPIYSDVGNHTFDVRVQDAESSVGFPFTLTVLDDPTATDLQSQLQVERTIWSTTGWVPVTATLINAGPKIEVDSEMAIAFSGEWYSDDQRCDADTAVCNIHLFDETDILFYVRNDQPGSQDLSITTQHSGFEIQPGNNMAAITLTFTEGSPTSPQFTVPAFGEGTVRAIGIADIQGGRWPEIMFANGPTEASTSYRFEQSLFTPVLHGHLADASDSYAMALFDADNDGDTDWVLANGNGEANTVYLNNGNGQFTLHGMLGNADSRGVAFGDIDEDGDIDLVFANGSDNNTLYWNDGAGNFTLGADLGAWESAAVIIKDLNRDGKADILFANRGFRNRLFFNRGNGNAVGQRLLTRNTAETSTTLWSAVELGEADDQTSSVVLADFDGDGDATDIVFVNDANAQKAASVEIFTIGSDEQSQQVARTENGTVTDIEVGDYDGDGRDDVALLRPGGALEVVQPQAGSLAVIDVMDTNGADTILLVDVDGSGKADVISANSSKASSRLDFSGEVSNVEALDDEDDSAPVTLPETSQPANAGASPLAATQSPRKGGAGSPFLAALTVLMLVLSRRRR